jgi:MFS transporter, PHS family, inorganic phosphate transporter
VFGVAALPAWFVAAWGTDIIGRRSMQSAGFVVTALAFLLFWHPGSDHHSGTILVLLGANYFFDEFGPNTTIFVSPAGIFPLHARTTAHGIAAALGKVGAFAGANALTASSFPRA